MTGSVVSAQERVKHRRRHVSRIQNNSSCGAEISSSLLSSSSTVILFHPSTPPNPRRSLRFRVFLLHPTNPDDGELASEWSHWWGSSIRVGDEPCQTPASEPLFLAPNLTRSFPILKNMVLMEYIIAKLYQFPLVATSVITNGEKLNQNLTYFWRFLRRSRVFFLQFSNPHSKNTNISH